MAPSSGRLVAAIAIALLCCHATADNSYSEIDGYIVQGDYAKARRLLQDMAQHGDAVAMYRLANLYRAGIGIPQDLPASKDWYERAAKLGHVPSEYMTGQCYERGIGTPKDLAQAADWYARAARAGYANARQRLSNLSERPIDLLQLMALDDERQVLDQLADRDLSVTDAHGQTLLMAAAAAGHEHVIEYLLQHGAQANQRDSSNRTALFYAADAGRDRAVLALLRAGANPNAADNSGDTPLHVAVAKGHPGALQLLQQHGGDMSLRNASGWTAAQLAQTKDVAANPSKGTSPESLDARGRLAGLRKDRRFDGWSDLSIAAWSGDDELVRLLIPTSDVSAPDKSGQTPLRRATDEGHRDIVRMLLAAGAKTDVTLADHEPLLIVALQDGFDDVAVDLVNADVALNVVDDQGRFPLGQAAARPDSSMLVQLLKHGANPNMVDDHGRTALMIAASANNAASVQALLAHGAAASSIDANQRSALWYAAGGCDEQQLSLLLKAVDGMTPAQRFTPDHDGITPLHRAVASKSPACVSALLTAGHNPNVASVAGSTPLHVAAADGQIAAARLLIDAHADMDAKDVRGDTPLILATKGHEFEMTQFLLQRGANARIRNTNAVSAYDLARNDHDERWLAMFDEESGSVLSLFGPKRTD